MKSIKIFFGCAVLSLVQLANASQWFDFKGQLACGTVISVRNVAQQPMYTQQFEGAWGGAGSSGSMMGALVSGNVVKAGVAVVAAIAIDTATSAVASSPEVKLPESEGFKNVRAVGFKLDDGRIINLPLLVAGKMEFLGLKYEVGERLRLQYNKQYKSIQILSSNFSAPKPDEPKYEALCKLRFDKEVADAIVQASEHLVDESKIID